MSGKNLKNLINRSNISIQLENPVWLLLIFYVCTPLFAGLLTGWMQSGRTDSWTKLGSIYFWVPIWLVSWWYCDLATRAVQFAIGKYVKSFLLVLTLGSVIGSILAWPLFKWHIQTSEILFGAGAIEVASPFSLSFTETFARFVDNVLAGIFFWVIMNYIFVAIVGMKRFGYEESVENFIQQHDLQIRKPLPDGIASNKKDIPLFLKRTKKDIGTEIIAISAEQHYLRVYTQKGDDLILYRLSDALLELEDYAGMQIHRSHWVKHSAIKNIETENRSLKVELSNGIRLPVGRSHQSKVRKLLQERDR